MVGFVDKLFYYANVVRNHVYEMPEEVIDYYDFSFITKGNLTYFANGKRIDLQAGDAIFLPPYTVRSRLQSNEKCEFVSFNFSTCEGVSFDFDLHIKNCISDEIRNIVDAYPFPFATFHGNSKEKCTCLLNYILYELKYTMEITVQNEYVLKAMRLIEWHVNDKYTLNDVAADVGLSKEYFATVFKKATGKTFTDYYNEKKMLIARSYLLSGKLTPEQIAKHLGYDNYNYFSRLFKKYFGMSPVKLKKSKWIKD